MPGFRSVSRADSRRNSARRWLHGITTTLLATAAAVLLPGAWTAEVEAAASGKPNIVLIMADDMGYGDVHALNPSSEIPTPHLDRLAEQGVSFTDAHSPSAVCTPTRYGLLTGRYCWRTRLKRGVLGGYSRPLIAPDRQTIAGMLHRQGYHTSVVGKWHLGMQMPMQPDAQGNPSKWAGDPGVDFTRPIAEGPTTRGFDHSFCVSASLDMPPYVYIEDDRFSKQPTIQQERVPFPAFVRAGPRAADFTFDTVLDRLTAEAVNVVRRRGQTEKPFFLYFPLTAPHKPTLPHERFRGRTGLGPYGDFIAQVDSSVGEVLDALDETGAADETLLVFTSDNGSYMHRYDRDRTDHVDDPSVQGYRAEHHRANGPFRGTKADIWEGGHHVPFFLRWPDRVVAGSECDAPIGHVDLFATCADVVGAELTNDVAEDSLSLVPLLERRSTGRGAPVIHHSARGMFAIRAGKWKLVLGNGSGGRAKPRGKPFGKPYRLFDLSEDVAETTNLAEQHPEVVERLTKTFEHIRKSGRSVNRNTSH